MAIQVRRGNEADFDASKMLPGEWAVSLDTKYVRMCFSPGIVLRMASYESFEADMELIQDILEECEEIQTAIERIKSEIDEKASLTIEYSNSASLSATRASEEAERAYEEAERAKNYADSAQSATNVQIATKDIAGIIKGGDNHIAEDGTLTLVTETTETTMPNSCEGRLRFKEIRGKTEKATSTGKNLLNLRDGLNAVGDGVTYTNRGDGTYSRVGTATGITGNAWFKGGYVEGVPSTEITNPIMTLKLGKSYFIGDCILFSVTKDGVAYGVTGAVTIQNEDVKVVGVRNTGQLVGHNYNDVIYPRVFEGLVDLGWEPYGVGIPFIRSVAISKVKTHSKNMLNCQGLTEQIFRGVTFTPNYDINGNLLYVEVDGTASGGVSTYYLSTFKFDSNKPCILSGCPSGGSDSKYTIYTENSAVGTDYGNGVTITSDLSANIRIGVANGVTVTNLRFYPMIRKADVEDATYEPYCGSSFTFSKPIELNKISNVQDTIVDGKPINRLKKVVLNGSESGWVDSSNSYFYLQINDMAKKSVYTNSMLCDVYNIAMNHANMDNYSITGYIDIDGIYPNSNWIYVRDSGATNLASFKAKLQANPITLVYELRTPTNVVSTADQVALNSIDIFDGTTYLEIDSPLQPEFVAEYGTSKVGGYTLEGMLAGRNGELMGKDYANRLTVLETAMVNNI